MISPLQHSLFVSTPVGLVVDGYGKCGGVEQRLHSISGLKFKWTADNKQLMKLEKEGESSGEH